jgi:uncharacterized protein YndB with AHSA1/START domain
MKHFRDEVRIEAPVERVWAVLCDTSHWKDWAPRSEFSDFSGPVDRVGTTYADTTRLMGFKFRMTTEVVEVEPLRLYHEHTDTGPVDIVLRLEPDGEATRLVVESDYEIAGRIPGFVKDIIARRWGEQNARQMLANIKAVAEAKVPAHA